MRVRVLVKARIVDVEGIVAGIPVERVAGQVAPRRRRRPASRTLGGRDGRGEGQDGGGVGGDEARNNGPVFSCALASDLPAGVTTDRESIKTRLAQGLCISGAVEVYAPFHPIFHHLSMIN